MTSYNSVYYHKKRNTSHFQEGVPFLFTKYNILEFNNINNSLLVVVRYFGGIKLGAGGLVRAYSKSVLECLAIAEIVEMELYELFRFTFDYMHIKTIDSEIRGKNLAVVEKQYETRVVYFIACDNVDMINNIGEVVMMQWYLL